MLDVTSEFDLPTERVWLNASHQGPLPRRAAAAVETMVRWKTQPHHLQPSCTFSELPSRLRSILARLIDAPAAEITLGNSASYGLHLVANGLELGPGDQVIVAANDFPSDILPWIRLERFGVEVVQLRPAGQVLTAPEIASAVTTSTKAVCLTWVHSFSGHTIDLDAIGAVCRDADALFVVNGSQAVGAMPIAVGDHPIDVLITVGFKWLCGPYGTGFCWLGPRAAERVRPTKLYWLTALSTDDLTRPELDLTSIQPATVGQHDVFGTANFFNNAGLAESAALLTGIGIDRIYHHNLQLAEQLIEGLDPDRFEVQPRGHPERLSSIVFVRPVDATPSEVARVLAAEAIDIAQRSGMIRFSPHLYNTHTDIERTLAALH